jgi:hypothetical protein
MPTKSGKPTQQEVKRRELAKKITHALTYGLYDRDSEKAVAALIEGHLSKFILFNRR